MRLGEGDGNSAPVYEYESIPMSHYKLSFLRTATLPSENARKKPHGPRKTSIGRAGRAQLPSGMLERVK